jgi:tRNA G18 (ribose-2'-O)-methylase SpoU
MRKLLLGKRFFDTKNPWQDVTGIGRYYEPPECRDDHSLRNCRRRGPLVIKASAGTVFRAPIIHCDAVGTALAELKQAGFRIAVLDSSGDDSLYDFQPASPTVFVLGSESEGISQQTLEVADIRVRIPMKNGVESLNVAVAAALVAFRLAAASP